MPRDEELQIADTILAQIKTGDRWCLAACGARDFIALDRNDDRRGGVTFRVTIKRNLFHKVLVELTHDDEYKVTLWGGKRKAINCGTLEVVECCCENLADVVYDLCNSREIRQIAI